MFKTVSRAKYTSASKIPGSTRESRECEGRGGGEADVAELRRSSKYECGGTLVWLSGASTGILGSTSPGNETRP
jgi:hypothetical protein